MRGGAISPSSRNFVSILSRFFDFRDKPTNSGPQRGPATAVHHITNVNDDGTIPVSPIPNYKAYNSFRSGDLAPPDGTKVPDLTLEVPELCTLECVDSKLILWVHVGNEGASPLTAGGTVEVHGAVLGVDTMLGTTELVDIINAGSYINAVAYELDPTDLESITITVSAKEQECNLGNNEVVLQGPFCQ